MMPEPAGASPRWDDRADGAVVTASCTLLVAVVLLTVISWQDHGTDALFLAAMMVLGLALGARIGRRVSEDRPGTTWLRPRVRLWLVIWSVVALPGGLILCLVRHELFNVYDYFTGMGL